MQETLTCRLCGGELKEEGGTYKCVHCGHTFVKKAEDDYAEKLKDILKEEKYEKVSAARQNLWAAMHEEYVSSSSCREYARELKSLVPSDYYANFAETANGKGEEEISSFLNKSSKVDMETYADAVLDFMIKSMTPGDLTAVCNYIDRAYPKASPEYAKYINLYEEEAENVESGIYELTMPRDVFVAYSSKDIDKVLELTDCLEEQGISCFISMRNLRHGRGAADNYDRALQTAIDNCKTVVFISSKNSRSLACDALRKEIPYIRKTDTDGAPAEYRSVAYEKIPYRYKKDRVEYLLDDYANTAADKIVKQFFDGVEWCKTSEDVADRVITYLTAVPEVDDKPRSKSLDDDDVQKIIAAIRDGEDGSRSGNIGADDIQKIIAAVSADRGYSVSVAEKEKNIIAHVKRLITVGDFVEAGRRLEELEEEEINVTGICPAVVYYYKILAENEVATDAELIEKYVKDNRSLADNGNFRLIRTCTDSDEKTKALEIHRSIEKGLEENERKRKEIEAQRRKEEEELLKTEYGLKYVETGAGGYTVAGIGRCEKTNIVIPAEHNGQYVVMIDANAFYNNSSLTSVSVPDGVTEIRDDAFSGCTSLSYVILPRTIGCIGSNAFSGCTSLKKIYYFGDSSEWRHIRIFSDNRPLTNSPLYYYSEKKPTEVRNFWHYDEDGNPVSW